MYKRAAVALTKRNLTWTLASGSTLGLLRHGGLIPHDYDGDLFVLINSAEDTKKMYEAVYDIANVKYGFRASNPVCGFRSYSLDALFEQSNTDVSTWSNDYFAIKRNITIPKNPKVRRYL